MSIDENEQQYVEASRRDQLPWPDYLDRTSVIKDTLGVSGVPFPCLVKEGVVIKILNSERTEEELVEYLK